jgi:peptidoglycan/LPS O-acetylase OafA/YrhL
MFSIHFYIMNTLLINDRRITYRNDKIDRLRFLLALSVLFVHLIPWASFYGFEVNYYAESFNNLFSKFFQPKGETNPAVLGFIVLSGYCIHRNGLRADYFHIKPYLIKRFFRIFPVYLLGTVLGIIIFLQLGFADLKIQAFTSTSAISWLGCIIKVTGISALSPFGFRVTAAVEFWLYLIYPLVILLLARYSEKVLWQSLILLSVLGVVVVIIFPEIKAWWHNGSIFSFLIYWYIGAKFVSHSFYQLVKRKRLYLIVVFLVLSLILILSQAELYIIVEIRKIVLALIFGLLLKRIDISGRNSHLQVAKFESIQKIWSLLIGCSYSLYALHTPLIVLGFALGIKLSNIIFAIITVSFLSYTFFEKPLIKYSKSLARKC